VGLKKGFGWTIFGLSDTSGDIILNLLDRGDEACNERWKCCPWKGGRGCCT